MDSLLLVPVYTALAYPVVAWATHHWRESWPAAVWAGYVLAWGQLAAGLLDWVGNKCLLVMLKRDDPGDVLPRRTRWLAEIKFFLLGLGMAYVLVALVNNLYPQEWWP